MSRHNRLISCTSALHVNSRFQEIRSGRQHQRNPSRIRPERRDCVGINTVTHNCRWLAPTCDYQEASQQLTYAKNKKVLAVAARLVRTEYSKRIPQIAHPRAVGIKLCKWPDCILYIDIENVGVLIIVSQRVYLLIHSVFFMMDIILPSDAWDNAAQMKVYII